MLDTAMKVEACLHDCIKTVEVLFEENKKLRAKLAELGYSDEEIKRIASGK